MDHEGRTVLRKKIRRAQVLKVFATLPLCLFGMEACGSAHHWARERRPGPPDAIAPTSLCPSDFKNQ